MPPLRKLVPLLPPICNVTKALHLRMLKLWIQLAASLTVEESIEEVMLYNFHKPPGSEFYHP
jgi:hypothetical protein